MKIKFLQMVVMMLATVQVSGQNYKEQNQTSSTGNMHYSIANIKTITPAEGYSAPVWSPDGKIILATKSHFTGLNIITLSSGRIQNLNDIPGAGYNAAWGEDSKRIYYRERELKPDKSSYWFVQSLNLETNKTLRQPKMNPNGISSNISAKKNTDPVIYTNTKTLLIEAEALDKNKKWVITNDQDQYYQAILSPDKTMVIVHKAGGMYVYATDGSGLINSLGSGLASGWSKDSKLILFFLSQDDGHQITGSDIYICDAIGSNKWQLTSTTDVYEMFPTWSPDNKQITFSDEKSGVVLVADLINQ